MSYSKDVLREMMEQRGGRLPRNLAFKTPRAFTIGSKGRPPRGNALSALDKRKLSYTRNEPYKADKPGSLTPRGSRLQGRIAPPPPPAQIRPPLVPIQRLGFLGRTIKYLANKLVGVGVTLGGLWVGFKLFVNESKEAIGNLIDSLPLSDEHKEWLKANMLLVVMSVGLLVGSAEAARRVTPRIMKVLRNRRIAAEIGDALDAGDETMARTILLDAIEDENVNLSAIRNRLSDEEFERLYKDVL